MFFSVLLQYFWLFDELFTSSAFSIEILWWQYVSSQLSVVHWYWRFVWIMLNHCFLFQNVVHFFLWFPKVNCSYVVPVSNPVVRKSFTFGSQNNNKNHGVVMTTFYYYVLSKSSIWFMEKHIFKIIMCRKLCHLIWGTYMMVS